MQLATTESCYPDSHWGLRAFSPKLQRGRWPHSLPTFQAGTARRCHEVPGSTGQADSKTKTDPFGPVFVLELLPGFEPGTSSLPKIKDACRGLLCLDGGSRSLLQKSIENTIFLRYSGVVSCCLLMLLDGRLLYLFFGEGLYLVCTFAKI